MADPTPKPPEEDIIIRTMKGDLDKLAGIIPKKEEKSKSSSTSIPTISAFKETGYKAPQAPIHVPTTSTLPAQSVEGPPILVVP